MDKMDIQKLWGMKSLLDPFFTACAEIRPGFIDSTFQLYLLDNNIQLSIEEIRYYTQHINGASVEDQDFHEALDEENWQSEDMLMTPTFQATITPGRTLLLRGSAVKEGFSPREAQLLTKFLSTYIPLPPEPEPFDIKDLHIERVKFDPIEED